MQAISGAMYHNNGAPIAIYDGVTLSYLPTELKMALPIVPGVDLAIAVVASLEGARGSESDENGHERARSVTMQAISGAMYHNNGATLEEPNQRSGFRLARCTPTTRTCAFCNDSAAFVSTARRS